jgi:hypothetical protein
MVKILKETVGGREHLDEKWVILMLYCANCVDHSE